MLTKDAVTKALGGGAGAPSVDVDAGKVTLTYASLADYSARTSADTEALRKLPALKSAEASCKTPEPTTSAPECRVVFTY